jgi:hypothetical protein
MHFAVFSLHVQKEAQVCIDQPVRSGVSFDLAVLGDGYESSGVVVGCVSF